jgi:circadian clock protein KaiC
VLISGTAGTGKTSLAAHFVNSACARGEKCVYFSFEESANQVIRNMRSIGIDLQRWINKGSLRFCATRPTTFGLEMHLVTMHSIINEFRPDIVVVDPLTALMRAGTTNETQSMLLRLIDFLKEQQITTLMTALTTGGPSEQTEVNVSSLVDTWMLLRDLESGGERNRGLYVIKARGLSHSNQIREFLLTDHGIELRNVYLGIAGVLTGSARIAQEAQEARETLQAQQEAQRQRSVGERKRKAIEAQIAALQAELEAETQESKQFEDQANLRMKQLGQERIAMEQSRSRNTVIFGNGLRGKPRGGGRQ